MTYVLYIFRFSLDLSIQFYYFLYVLCMYLYWEWEQERGPAVVMRLISADDTEVLTITDIVIATYIYFINKLTPHRIAKINRKSNIWTSLHFSFLQFYRIEYRILFFKLLPSIIPFFRNKFIVFLVDRKWKFPEMDAYFISVD